MNTLLLSRKAWKVYISPRSGVRSKLSPLPSLQLSLCSLGLFSCLHYSTSGLFSSQQFSTFFLLFFFKSVNLFRLWAQRNQSCLYRFLFYFSCRFSFVFPCPFAFVVRPSLQYLWSVSEPAFISSFNLFCKRPASSVCVENYFIVIIHPWEAS